ncbi:hypothetical protein [Caproiciproducens galactitolivorans]|uniref:hypothetical protein n=1 Tax=Caproiciproducens galactitolivorans TaxID=642589 RepID=UPI00240A9290|nr:hypothetical protein [Caproiciproducens galactitolivorans]
MKFSAPELFISCSDTENAIESTSESHALDLTLNKVEETLKDAESALNCGCQAISDAATAATSANSVANTAT